MNLFSLPLHGVIGATTLCLHGMLAVVAYAEEFRIDKTSENIPKKALIIKKDAKFFANAEDGDATEAPFMQLYFLMTPSRGERVPVLKSFSVNKTQPEGWLEKESFVEWNTVQMINFEPQQGGRELVRIYDTFECSQMFSEGESLGECQELGRESKTNSLAKKQYKFLIPVFQQDKGNYYGGFIGIQEEKKEIRPVETTSGYDVILVVDSTLSMTRYFRPTMLALQNFVKQVQESTTKNNNMVASLNVGLLFYRDRDLKNKNCKVGYLTQWAQPLTEKVEEVIRILEHAETTNCDDLDEPEAVFDALNRAIVDTEWHNTFFNSIFLIGDAPPHLPSNIEKNPQSFSVEFISKLASEKNIRFLTFKIEDKDTREFKDLALATDAARKGIFRTIAKGDISQFEQDLQKALMEEWSMVMKTQILYNTKNSTPSNFLTPQRESLNISDYEYPIIISNFHLPFMTGWVPQKVKGRSVIGEYVFMRKNDLKILTNTLDTIGTRFVDGQEGGSEMVISTIRDTLATQLKLNPSEIFQSGESLGELLKKTYVLPFRSEILELTPEQINTFKPSDYQKIGVVLSKKVKSLREFHDNPLNIHNFFGDSYLYVPRAYFP